VLAPRDAHTPQFESIPGLTYIELSHFRATTYSVFRNRLLRKELERHYSRLKPDLIFHYTIKANIYGSIAARHAGIPSISIITGLGYTFAKKGWLRSVVKLLYKKSLRTAAEVWFLNEDDLHTFTTARLVDPARTFLLPGEGVDPDVFFPAPFANGKKSVTFLFVGRMIRYKGIYEYVEAARLLRQKGLAVNCQLLGFFDDNPAAIPRTQIDEWHNNGIISYLGHTDAVAEVIEQADCIVLPSYYREGIPLSLLEGASMCKALIAADTSGCRTLIREGVNGYLCKEKDVASLAEKMTAYYYLSPAEKRQMGLEGRKTVLQRFANDIIVDIYRTKINSILHPRE
jgi:glycosyltransferase involved in cell wall biosynthesis